MAQPAVAAIGMYRVLKDQMKQGLKDLPTDQVKLGENLPKALCFAVDAIKNYSSIPPHAPSCAHAQDSVVKTLDS